MTWNFVFLPSCCSSGCIADRVSQCSGHLCRLMPQKVGFFPPINLSAVPVTPYCPITVEPLWFMSAAKQKKNWKLVVGNTSPSLRCILVAKLGKWFSSPALKSFPFIGNPGMPGDVLETRVLRIIWPHEAWRLSLKYSTKMVLHRLVLRNVCRKCGSGLLLEDLLGVP